MRVRLFIPLILGAALLSSCTPAFSVRLYNRSGRDFVVEWKDARAMPLRAEKDAIVGSAHDWSAKNVVSLDFGDAVALYRIPELWNFSKEAMRPMRFPAAAGSRECCLEVGADFTVYAVHAKTLQRLSPQPSGFPIAPRELKKKPNSEGSSRRQSQRGCVSRLVLSHESRQAPPWLIFNDGERKHVVVWPKPREASESA